MRFRVCLFVVVAFATNSEALAEWEQTCVDAPWPIPPPVDWDCCLPDGGCQTMGTQDSCYNAGGAPDAVGGSLCIGDADGDGIDDGCGCSGGSTGTACCLPDGCQDELAPAECEALGGMPFGPCAPCGEVSCPNPACVAATGSCDEAHGAAGCDHLWRCTNVCADIPGCCEETAVPATSNWGLALMAVLLLTAGPILFHYYSCNRPVW